MQGRIYMLTGSGWKLTTPLVLRYVMNFLVMWELILKTDPIATKEEWLRFCTVIKESVKNEDSHIQKKLKSRNRTNTDRTFR